MNIGDLVVYNCAGMFHKTLGIILKDWHDENNCRYIMIRWGTVGEMMPKPSYDYYKIKKISHPSFHKEVNQNYLWYDAWKNYFTVVS